MARFEVELPHDLMKQLDALNGGSADQMMNEMLDAAGDYVAGQVENNVRKVFKKPGVLLNALKKTVVYRTPTDDAKNVKVMFTGYVKGSKPTPRHPKGTPIALIALAREYGTSSGEEKRPFLRPAFNKKRISEIMLKVQEKYIPED